MKVGIEQITRKGSEDEDGKLSSIPAELMGNVGGIIGCGMPTGLQGRRDSLTDFEQALKSDRLEEEVEKQEIVVADHHGQVGLQLTQGEYQCPHIQIRRG